jgi:hypothetical protein
MIALLYIRKGKELEMQSMMVADRRLDLLDARVKLNISLNDLRVVVNCFKAMEYQGKVDNETYLNGEARSLKQRLEGTYRTSLARLGL